MASSKREGGFMEVLGSSPSWGQNVYLKRKTKNLKWQENLLYYIYPPPSSLYPQIFEHLVASISPI